MKRSLKLFSGLFFCQTLALIPSQLNFVSFAFAQDSKEQNLSLLPDEFTCQQELPQNELTKITSKVETSYKATKFLRAKFLQTSFFIGLGESKTSAGKLIFKKPGMMDWNYEQPEKQRFLSNGELLWFYQPKLNQVTVSDFQNAFDSELPVSFLLGVGELSKSFNIVSACKTKVGTLAKFLTNKPDQKLENFYLLIQKDTNLPIGARVIDAGENETAILFTDLETTVKTGEKPIDDKNFEFSIPKGVDVIDNRGNSKSPKMQEPLSSIKESNL